MFYSAATLSSLESGFLRLTSCSEMVFLICSSFNASLNLWFENEKQIGFMFLGVNLGGQILPKFGGLNKILLRVSYFLRQ